MDKWWDDDFTVVRGCLQLPRPLTQNMINAGVAAYAVHPDREDIEDLVGDIWHAMEEARKSV
jgi:hypothetical protein